MGVDSFASFTRRLEEKHGAQAARLRHEVFFQSRKPFPDIRARLALLRDAFLLWKTGLGKVGRPAPRRGLPIDQGRPLAILVATLAGASGWNTLARSLPSLHDANYAPVILAHPRLPASLFPPDIPLLRPISGFPGRTLLAALTGRNAVALAQARHLLWRRAIAETLGERKGVLVLHNDFDMMSSAGLSCGRPSLCLQHGIPTDEFFPCLADYQIVWGQSSRQAYSRAGTRDDCLIPDHLGRGDTIHAPQSPPFAMAVASQSQAAIFGPELPGLVRNFVSKLHPHCSVLLHPQEGPRHGYGPARISHPPHDMLNAKRPALIMAYCSTLILEAALAGHWVATLDFPIGGNQAAHDVADSPLRIASPDQALAVFHRLSDDVEFRQAAAVAQVKWLKATFAAEQGGFAALLSRMALS